MKIEVVMPDLCLNSCMILLSEHALHVALADALATAHRIVFVSLAEFLVGFFFIVEFPGD